jgi:hypothetical protein
MLVVRVGKKKTVDTKGEGGSREEKKKTETEMLLD